MIIGRLSRRSILAAVPAALLSLPLSAAAQSAKPTPLQIMTASGVGLSGVYPGHLRGVCTNDRDAIYWSMTYDAEDLSLLARHPVSEVVYGAGGIAFADGRFIVVGGLPDGMGENYIYEYDRDFTSGRKIVPKTGQTFKGIQTAAFDGDRWWFGCYAKSDFAEVLIRTDRTFGAIQSFSFDGSTGIVPLDRDTLLVARSVCGKESCVARLAPVGLNAWIHTGRLRPL